jgi:sugar-specific transcriptional regulator TrmB
MVNMRYIRYNTTKYLTEKGACAIMVSIIMTTQNDDLIASLRAVGFSTNEALVYLATLELGQASIWEIAKKSGIKRPTCYVLLEELAFRGFASSANDGKRVIYSVSSPKQLLQAVERRQERFIKSLAQLEGVASKSPQKPTVRLYEGVSGVMEAYNLSLEQPKGNEILIYGTAQVQISYGEFIAEYLKKRVKKGISARALLPDKELSRQVMLKDKAELRQTRFLPENKFDPTTEINVFGESITYIAHSEKEPFGTVIESSSLARLEKQRFELLWDLAVD